MQKILCFILLLSTTIMAQPQTATSIYDFEVMDIDHKPRKLSEFKGKKMIIVNVASECGNTPQYAQLEEIYRKNKNNNFVIIGFPANNFGGQEPGTDAEIKQFCTKEFQVTFPMMAKISVTGTQQAPLYKWLTSKEHNGVKDEPVTWNFQKFLIDEKGNWVGSVAPGVAPAESEQLMNFISR